MPKIIDVFQGDYIINWPQVLSGPDDIVGGIIKAGDGYFCPRNPLSKSPTGQWVPASDYTGNHLDPRFPENWAALRTAQTRGLYWYERFNYEYRPWDKDAGMERQAQMCYDYAMAQGDLLPTDEVMADSEQPFDQLTKLSAKQITDRFLQFIDKLEDLFNRYSMIYTGWGWWNDPIKGVGPELKRRGKLEAFTEKRKLLVADYTDPLRLPMGWSSYFAHQYTDRAKVRGVEVPCDLSRTGKDWAPNIILTSPGGIFDWINYNLPLTKTMQAKLITLANKLGKPRSLAIAQVLEENIDAYLD